MTEISVLQKLRVAAIGVAGIAGLLIALRALGPVEMGYFRVHSPLPAESVFAICFIWLASAYRAAPVTERSCVTGPRWLLASILVALIAIAFARNLHDPFLSDDYILVSRATADPSHIAPLLTMPGGDGAFRPLGYLYFGLVKLWARTDPLKWHVCGLALHSVNCLLVFWLAWKLWLNAWAAFAAALVFGLHGTRPEVVTWTAGSFDLLAAFFALSSAILFFQWRRFRAEAAALLFLAAGILCKESAYCYPFLILGLAAAGGKLDRRTLRFTGLAALVCSLLFAYRWFLFHGPGGYVDPATGRPQILSLHVFPTLKALFIRIWAILLFPIDWDAANGVGLALAVLAIGAAWFWLAAIKPARASGILLATVAACALPAAHLAAIGQSAIGSRILYLPSVAFCIFVGLLARGKRLAPIALAISSIGVLNHNLTAWHETALLAERTCAKVAAGPAYRIDGLPRVVGGAWFFANGFDECVQMRRGNAPVSDAPAVVWTWDAGQLRANREASGFAISR